MRRFWFAVCSVFLVMVVSGCSCDPRRRSGSWTGRDMIVDQLDRDSRRLDALEAKAADVERRLTACESRPDVRVVPDVSAPVEIHPAPDTVPVGDFVRGF